MKYLPLFNLYLKHGYYSDGRCFDFELDPTPQTQMLLQGARQLYKGRPDGGQIYVAVTDDFAPFVSLQSELIFKFYLRLRNQDFPLFTDLSAITLLDSPMFTTTGLKQTSTAPVQLTLVSRQVPLVETFFVHQPAKKDSFRLNGHPIDKIQLPDFEVAGLPNVTKGTGYDPATRVITIDTQNAAKETAFTVTYPVRPVKQKDVFAFVEINLGALPSKIAGPTEFQINFQPKSAKWEYYVLTRAAVGVIQLVDSAEKTTQIQFEHGVDLKKQPDSFDKIASSLLDQYSNANILRFVSTTPVPCQQKPPQVLQLRQDGNQVGATLPNPPLTNFAMLTRVENGQTVKEVTLFQVVKNLTDS
jgi:hypothetical protein